MSGPRIRNSPEMDETWKYFLGLCVEDDLGKECLDLTLDGEICVPPKINIRLNPEFTCRRRDNPERDHNLPYESEISPKLKVKPYQRPLTSDEDICFDLELPFSVEEYEFLCKEIPDPMWGSTFCARRIFLLLHITPEIADIETRIWDLWTFFERRSPHGVYVKDIRILLGIIFSLLSQEGEESLDNFRQSLLEKVMAQLKRGIRVQKLSDKEDLSEFTNALSDFGEIIRRNYTVLLNGTIEILENWLENYGRNANDSAKNPRVKRGTQCFNFQDQLLDKTTFANCAEESHLGKRLLQQIVDPKISDQLYVQLVSIAGELIDLSPTIRLLALKKPVIESILFKLKNSDTGNHLLIHAVEVIYALLADPLDDDFTAQLPPLKEEAFRVLLFRFLQRMKYIRSKSEISLRNDVAFAIYLMVKTFPNLRVAFGRHANVLAGIVSNNVISQKDLPFVLDSTPDDIELLKFLVWILQLILESDEAADEIVERYQMVVVMIRILIGPCHILENMQDSNPSLEPLIKVTALTLSTIAKRFPLMFQQPEGIDTMLKILEIYSQFATLDQGLVLIMLDILRILLTTEVEGMVEYFIQKEAMLIFTNVLKEFSQRDWGMSDEPIMCNILLCCSILGQYDESQRQIFVDNLGVKVLVRIINLLAYSHADQRHMNPTLHICVAEVIWQCLAESPSALEMFLAFEGMFRVLDLLEVAAGPAAQLHILSCLVELCEYPRCVDQLMYWRRRDKNLIKRFAQGDEFYLPVSLGHSETSNATLVGDGVGDVFLERDNSLSAFLCELWRHEENRFRVLRESNGIIASLEKPLMSEFSRDYETRSPLSSDCSGPASLDLISSLRPKIYLLIKKIVEASNTEATIFGGLSLPNQITMQIIINFLDLKRGEIWLEMAQELRQEEVKLVDSDEIALDRFLKISRNKVSAVVDTQRYLLNRVQEHDETSEKTLYNTIQMCYLQDHLEAVREAEFFARTSNYFLLVDKRLWQKVQLQQMVRVVGNVNARIHRTTNNSLNITNWPGRTKMIESEPTFEHERFDETKALAEARKYTIKTTVEETESERLLQDENINEDEVDEESFHRSPLVPSSFEPSTEFGSAEEGLAQVPPQALKKALLSLLKEEKKWKWRDAQGENAWRMRSKWRSNWYSGN